MKPNLDAFDAVGGLTTKSRDPTVVEQVTQSTSQEGEMTSAAQALATAALVDFAQGTNPAAIIGTQRHSEDTNALIAIRHFADPVIRPIVDDVLLANSGAGDQFKRLYKIARGQKSTAGNAASAFKKLLRPGGE